MLFQQICYIRTVIAILGLSTKVHNNWGLYKIEEHEHEEQKEKEER